MRDKQTRRVRNVLLVVVAVLLVVAAIDFFYEPPRAEPVKTNPYGIENMPEF